MAEFPKVLTQVWQASDGSIHATEASALVQEGVIREKLRKEKVREAIASVVVRAKFHDFGEFRDPSSPSYQAALVDKLLKAGLDFV